MVMWLNRSDPNAIIEEERPHEVIQLHAGSKIRIFCNWIHCPYEDIIDNQDTADQAATEHESLNYD
jgi:hypothetical protein